MFYHVLRNQRQAQVRTLADAHSLTPSKYKEERGKGERGSGDRYPPNTSATRIDVRVISITSSEQKSDQVPRGQDPRVL